MTVAVCIETMEKEFKLLDIKDWRIVKTIRIEKNLFGRYGWAHIIYMRKVLPNYVVAYEKKEKANGLWDEIIKTYPIDELDNLILQSIRTQYPEAVFHNYELYSDSSIEDMIRLFKANTILPGNVYLNPTIINMDYHNIPMGSTFLQFQIPLQIFVPCEEFKLMFSNEYFSDNYDFNNTSYVQKVIKESMPTYILLSDLWK